MTERNYENEYWTAQAHINELEGENGKLKEKIEQATLDLPRDYRIVLVLRDQEGFSTAETAAILGQPVGTVKWRTAGALGKLKHLLNGKART